MEGIMGFLIFLMAIVIVIQEADISLMKKDYREDMELLTKKINELNLEKID